jgi:hypothetical protein
MQDLVDKYGKFDPSYGASPTARPQRGEKGKTIVSRPWTEHMLRLTDVWQLLTGATGSLGSYLLAQFAQLPPDIISKVICLVRADVDDIASKRVRDALANKELEVESGRLKIYASDLAEDRLGLSDDVYASLLAEVDVVLHVRICLLMYGTRLKLTWQAAWPVHFASSLISFEDNIKGQSSLEWLVGSNKHIQALGISSTWSPDVRPRNSTTAPRSLPS